MEVQVLEAEVEAAVVEAGGESAGGGGGDGGGGGGGGGGRGGGGRGGGGWWWTGAGQSAAMGAGEGPRGPGAARGARRASGSSPRHSMSRAAPSSSLGSVTISGHSRACGRAPGRPQPWCGLWRAAEATASLPAARCSASWSGLGRGRRQAGRGGGVVRQGRGCALCPGGRAIGSISAHSLSDLRSKISTASTLVCCRSTVVASHASPMSGKTRKADALYRWSAPTGSPRP